MWSTLSASASDPSFSWLNPFNEKKVSLSFCEGSLADVSVTALSEPMFYKGEKAKSNVLPVSPMCVVCSSVSSTARAQMTERNQTCEVQSSK